MITGSSMAAAKGAATAKTFGNPKAHSWSLTSFERAGKVVASEIRNDGGKASADSNRCTQYESGGGISNKMCV